MTEPAAPLRQAATVLLLRDAPAGLQVYLLRRSRGMTWGGMSAYPGGAVDPRDGDVTTAWVGPSPAEWGAVFGCGERIARELVCAAVRETFEEAGVLLAGPPDHPESVVPDVSGDDWERQRQALLRRELSLAELLAGRGLALRSDLLRPFAHWVTPPVEPRRFDTKFFAAALPVGQEARDVSGEADEADWSTPAAALAEFDAGTRPMLPPTAHTLGQLRQYDDVAAVLAGAPPDPLRPIMPVFRKTPDGRWAVLPDGTRIRFVGGRRA